MTERRTAHAAAPGTYWDTLTTGAKRAWLLPSLRYLFLFSGVVSAGAAAPLLLLQQPWLVAHDVAVADVGLWQAGVHLISVLAALTAGSLILRFGEGGAFALLPVTLFACGAVLGTADSLWAAAAFVGIAAARGLHQPVLATHVNRRIESEQRATTLSAQSLVGNVVMASVWPIGGLVGDRLGLRSVFWAFAAGTAVLGFGALFLWARADRGAAERRRGAWHSGA
jgi:MFS family permease